MNSFNGTEKEFEDLIERHKSAVYGTAYAYFGYNSEIDDVVQETFIHAYYSFGKIRDKSKVGAWLCGVARNISLKKLRGRHFHLPLDRIESLKGGDTEALYIRRETNAEIRRAISSLSEPVAETVSLYYFSEKSVREISLLLSVPEGTVKSRLHDGRKKLKGDLIKMMENERSTVIKKDIADDIRKAIQAAKYENDKGYTAAALSLLDDAAKKAGEAEHRMLCEIYRLRALVHISGPEAIADGEKSVAYARLTGDRRLIAQSLLSHAFNLGDKAAIGAFTEAYELASSIGYFEVCAECAFWLGTHEIKNENYAAAKRYFLDALDCYSKFGKTDGANCCIGDSVRVHAFASAAIRSMEMLNEKGHLNGDYISLNTFCQLIHVEDDRLVTDNDYGWNIPGRQNRTELSGRICGHFAMQQLILSETLLETGEDTYEYYCGEGVLVNRHYRIVSREENVTVAAGSFEGCLHVKVTETIPAYDPANENQREVYKYLDDTEYWYAPDIGQIKSIMSLPNKEGNEPYSYELKEYSAFGSDVGVQKYMPLNVGNRWEYVLFDKDGNEPDSSFCYRDCYEVDALCDGIAYISNSGFTFAEPAEASAD